MSGPAAFRMMYSGMGGFGGRSRPAIATRCVAVRSAEGSLSVPQAGGVSATSELGESSRREVAGLDGGLRESVLVLVMVLLPVPMATILTVIGVLVIVGWQWLNNQPVRIPDKTSIKLVVQCLYIIISWIDVAVVWRWASRRGLRGDIFVFRRVKALDLAACPAGFVVAMYGAPLMTHWLSQVTGGKDQGFGSNLAMRGRSRCISYCSL